MSDSTSRTQSPTLPPAATVQEQPGEEQAQPNTLEALKDREGSVESPVRSRTSSHAQSLENRASSMNNLSARRDSIEEDTLQFAIGSLPFEVEWQPSEITERKAQQVQSDKAPPSRLQRLATTLKNFFIRILENFTCIRIRRTELGDREGSTSRLSQQLGHVTPEILETQTPPLLEPEVEEELRTALKDVVKKPKKIDSNVKELFAMSTARKQEYQQVKTTLSNEDTKEYKSHTKKLRNFFQEHSDARELTFDKAMEAAFALHNIDVLLGNEDNEDIQKFLVQLNSSNPYVRY